MKQKIASSSICIHSIRVTLWVKSIDSQCHLFPYVKKYLLKCHEAMRQLNRPRKQNVFLVRNRMNQNLWFSHFFACPLTTIELKATEAIVNGFVVSIIALPLETKWSKCRQAINDDNSDDVTWDKLKNAFPSRLKSFMRPHGQLNN